MLPTSDEPTQQRQVYLPNGTQITENGPVVIVGPNGSGKL